MMKLRIFHIAFFAVILFTSCNRDQPKHLSKKIETVDLHYIQWACDCARFVESKYYIDEDLEGNELAAKCIFIEPSSDLIEDISEEYYLEGHFNQLLRLTGEYYLDKGIPSNYEQATERKPDYARVFRYSKVEYIDK